MSEFSNMSSLKLLRSVELFSKLTILQLSRIAESLMEVSFADGQVIIDKVPGRKPVLRIFFFCCKINFIFK